MNCSEVEPNCWKNWKNKMNVWYNNCNTIILWIYFFQRQFTLILQAREEASAGVIEEASYSGIVLPGPKWHTLNHHGQNAHLAYQVRVQCSDHYYNATCTKFCRPRNDIFGHYTCDENGDKVCIQGWKGADCETGKKIIIATTLLYWVWACEQFSFTKVR